jgi:hypothetical protein
VWWSVFELPTAPASASDPPRAYLQSLLSLAAAALAKSCSSSLRLHDNFLVHAYLHALYIINPYDSSQSIYICIAHRSVLPKTLPNRRTNPRARLP